MHQGYKIWWPLIIITLSSNQSLFSKSTSQTVWFPGEKKNGGTCKDANTPTCSRTLLRRFFICILYIFLSKISDTLLYATWVNYIYTHFSKSFFYITACISISKIRLVLSLLTLKCQRGLLKDKVNIKYINVKSTICFYDTYAIVSHLHYNPTDVLKQNGYNFKTMNTILSRGPHSRTSYDISYRPRIGRDAHLDQSEACTIYRKLYKNTGPGETVIYIKCHHCSGTSRGVATRLDTPGVGLKLSTESLPHYSV